MIIREDNKTIVIFGRGSVMVRNICSDLRFTGFRPPTEVGRPITQEVYDSLDIDDTSVSIHSYSALSKLQKDLKDLKLDDDITIVQVGSSERTLELHFLKDSYNSLDIVKKYLEAAIKEHYKMMAC